MSSRAAALMFSIVLLAITLSPLRRDPADDGFPLSTYPMFAWKRERSLTMSYPIGETARGERRYLTPALIGSSEVMQARAIVERSVRSLADALALCQQIAARVAVSDDFAGVVRIRIVTGTHDAIEFLAGGRVGRERDRAACEVRR